MPSSYGRSVAIAVIILAATTTRTVIIEASPSIVPTDEASSTAAELLAKFGDGMKG